ncbi:MAG: pyridoxamine 5'-phosphate oxidase family protein [Firmicutes bacterium]|nr:pyridoxamine 5'-phosphate oxidase family protein [Bacillota bacterium]
MPETYTKEQIQEMIKGIIRGSHVASMATVWEDRPWVRYIMTHNDGDNMSLYTSTSVKLRKVAHVRANHHVHLTLGWESQNPGPYVQFVGTAIIHTDEETKKKQWKPQFEPFFGNADNPDYCIIEFIPDYIEVWGYTENAKDCLMWEA